MPQVPYKEPWQVTHPHPNMPALPCPPLPCPALPPPGVEKVLTRTPGYDVRQLLAGSTPALTALVSSFSSSSGWLLNAVEPAPGLSGAERAAAAAALQTAVSVRGAGGPAGLSGMVVSAGAVACTGPCSIRRTRQLAAMC